MDSLFLERRSALAVNIYVLDESIDSFQLALFRDLLEQCVYLLARVLFHIASPSLFGYCITASGRMEDVGKRFPDFGKSYWKQAAAPVNLL